MELAISIITLGVNILHARFIVLFFSNIPIIGIKVNSTYLKIISKTNYIEFISPPE
jgi:hypothetical protein